ncbi:Actin-like protein arp9 [Rhizina undulata]
MPAFRDEHVLMISAGSQVTLAQLGLPESFTPAKLRVPSRMFPGIEPGTWTATKIREAREGEKEDFIARSKAAMVEDEEEEEGEEEGEGEEGEEREEGKKAEDGENTQQKTQAPATAGGERKDKPEDSTMVDGDEGEERDHEHDHHEHDHGNEHEDEEDEDMGDGEGVYVEDEDDEEGAVWCMKEGRVVNWGCFFALLTHVHETINPTFHTPILLLHPPTFTRRDKELVTQFVFEKLKAPGFALIDSAQAVSWAYGLSTATIVDVGYEKVDITPICDFIIQERARETIYNCGGDSMTRHLATLLPHLKFEEVEQLKKSNICEILPAGTPFPTAAGTAAAAAAGAKRTEMMRTHEDALSDEEEGNMNVAAIVAAGKTHEYLARKEKERRGEAERRLPNREREKNTFWVVEKKRPGEEPTGTVPMEIVGPVPTTESNGTTEQDPAASQNRQSLATSPITTSPQLPEGPPTEEQLAAQTTAIYAAEDVETAKKHKQREKRKEEKRAAAEGLVLGENETRRQVEVGIERFMAAECGIFHRIADALCRSIMKVEDSSRKQDLWENLVVCGNGCKVKGFKDALLATINNKYIISPSSATIFSSELPSNLSTPLATGTSTPLPIAPGAPSQPNPLLVAATTNNLNAGQNFAHSGHSQAPAAVKIAKIPDYFPEWKDAGFEEASFLGAQVVAKVLFVLDQGQSNGFMTRVEYNEVGPMGIHNI